MILALITQRILLQFEYPSIPVIPQIDPYSLNLTNFLARSVAKHQIVHNVFIPSSRVCPAMKSQSSWVQLLWPALPAWTWSLEPEEAAQLWHSRSLWDCPLTWRRSYESFACSVVAGVSKLSKGVCRSCCRLCGGAWSSAFLSASDAASAKPYIFNNYRILSFQLKPRSTEYFQYWTIH